MDHDRRRRTFLKSRSGQGLVLFLVFSACLSAVVGYGFYAISLSWFEEHKSEEKVTALALVDAFVDTYSQVRGATGPDAPVPATFRAHAIERFAKAGGQGEEFRLRLVGLPGREIATPPSDAAMAQAVEALAAEKAPKPVEMRLLVNGELVFRTLYPSVAKLQSCVDCHNQIQPDQHWALNDVMGAFAIDVPAGPFIRSSVIQASGLGIGLMLALSAVGALVAVLHRRQVFERERAQATLEASEQRFRDFAEAASDWFWEQDENLRFTFTSRSAPDRADGSVIGRTREELAASGENFGISDKQWHRYHAEIAARRPFQDFRLDRIGSNGEIRHVSVSGRPIFDDQGQFRGYRGIGRDVTATVSLELELAQRVEERTAELRNAQNELLRKEKLSTLGQLTATVAHELRNPLSAIRNTVYAIRETVAKSGLDLERPLTRVERNIQRCDRIIGDLLDFSRFRDLNRVPVEIDGWLDEVLSEQRMPQGVILRCSFGGLRQRLALDVERMRRVVINLVDNAAQAMADVTDGRERLITVSTRSDGDEVELAVEDTGPGMPPDVLAKVFEPLFSTKNFGTGLGLPTVRQIVEQHGGTVTLSSEPDKGTRAVVRLPCVMSKELAA